MEETFTGKKLEMMETEEEFLQVFRQTGKATAARVHSGTTQGSETFINQVGIPQREERRTGHGGKWEISPLTQEPNQGP